MANTVRSVRPQLEALSPTALDVLRVLEPVLGRIIAVAVIKYASHAIQLDPLHLQPEHVEHLVPHIERSLVQYDRLGEVGDALRRLAATSRGPA
ncbi:MAG: hypothetical protein ABIJ09_09020 [Pseudomonadota bacterium]